MKICPKCFAEYDEKEALEGTDFCIECYGESEDIKLVDKDAYLTSMDMDDLILQKEKTEKLRDKHLKKVMLRRIDRLIGEKSKL